MTKECQRLSLKYFPSSRLQKAIFGRREKVKSLVSVQLGITTNYWDELKVKPKGRFFKGLKT